MMKRNISLIMLCMVTSSLAWAVDVVRNPVARKQSVMVFVSLSMPRQSLIALLRDANKIKASVIMRGLVHDSFKETVQEIASLVKEADSGGIALDPLAFKKFHIETVPAVVVVSPDHPCLMQQHCDRHRDYDVMFGNIPLSAALKEIRDRGVAASDEARHAFDLLQEGAYV